MSQIKGFRTLIFLSLHAALVLSPSRALAQAEAQTDCELYSPTHQEELNLRANDNPDLQIKVSDQLFKLSSLPSDPQHLALFQTLTDNEKLHFYSRRKKMLASVASAIAFPKTLGFLAISRQKIRACLRKAPEAVASEKLVEVDQINGKNKITALGLQAIAETLTALDQNLWRDANIVSQAQSTSIGLLVGVSSGLAVGKVGYFKMYGLELQIGVDHKTDQSFIKINRVQQNLDQAVYAFEQMINVGLMRHYTLSETINYDSKQIIAPPFFGYRYGENQVSMGFLSGLAFTDLASGALAYMGLYELSAGLVAVTKPLQTMSLFWANTSSKTIIKKEVLRPSQWITSLKSKFKNKIESIRTQGRQLLATNSDLSCETLLFY